MPKHRNIPKHKDKNMREVEGLGILEHNYREATLLPIYPNTKSGPELCQVVERLMAEINLRLIDPAFTWWWTRRGLNCKGHLEKKRLDWLWWAASDWTKPVLGLILIDPVRFWCRWWSCSPIWSQLFVFHGIPRAGPGMVGGQTWIGEDGKA